MWGRVLAAQPCEARLRRGKRFQRRAISILTETYRYWFFCLVFCLLVDCCLLSF